MYFRFRMARGVDSAAAAVMASVPPDVGDEPGDVPQEQTPSVFRRTVAQDVTGDGRPDTLRLIGTVPDFSKDSIVPILTIETNGQIVYEQRLDPITRAVGFDGGRRILTGDEYREHIREFATSFLDASQFRPAAAFRARLQSAMPAHVARIGQIIEADRPPSDGRSGEEIWREIEDSDVPVFTYSPGGDALVAIAWSATARRFYKLLSCC
jgi:hypothetical protein